ncbi:MAG: hypothetical protein JWR50_3504 [Mucilaginibacter sp.]|nr:hypothetical protein [Mucilaginibacter sp.]
MKKFRPILIALFMCVSMFAAKTAHAQFTVGARAGANLATEPVPDLYHVFLARPYAGLFGQYSFSGVGVQVGVNYSGEGANYKDLSTNDVFHIRQSFLTIPVLVSYKFGFGGYIEAGPQFGFLLSAKEQDGTDPYMDTKKYYKGTDVSAGLGLGYDFKPSSALKGFGFNVRYMRGLTNLNKDVVGTSTDGIKSRVLSIGLTYKLTK